jgi:hypothetical protein
MKAGMTREAKLLAEYAHLYPGVPAGVWMPAADLGAALLLAHLQLSVLPRLGNRLLDEQHFEFRGGGIRGPESDERTRSGEEGERASPPARLDR